jgi:RNA polymerase sigma factor (sigma-70 family)
MTRVKPLALLRRIRTLAMPQTFRDFSDRQLLESFLDRQDEAAFAALVERHGAMTLGVCRRVLRHVHDAEDACQATFLVLAQKAGSIRKKASLGSWLHGVAFRVASDLRKRLARRQRVPVVGKFMGADALDDITLREALAILDEELNQLAECYRTPLILCCLEGKARDEAAEQLGWKLGTLKSRLERGRELLRSRLVRRGITPSVALLGAVFTGSASAMMPATLALATIKAASWMAWNETLPATLVPAHVVSLTKGSLQTMIRTKLKHLLLIVAVCVLGLAAGLWQIVATAQQEPLPRRDPAGADSGDERAARLGQDAHAQAAAIGKLPRLSYQTRYRYGVVDALRATDASLETFHQALAGPVRDQDWIGWYERGFSWDEKRLLYEMRPGKSIFNYKFVFGTANDAWDRSENNAKTQIMFVRRARAADFWSTPDNPFGSAMHLFDLSYLRVTPHQYPWGTTIQHTSHTMSFIPLEKATWKHLGTETFGEEMCEVVESAHADSGTKGQRLWISQQSGRLRGVLSYLANSQPNELARFDEYREVSPGVWLPFREVRTFPHSSETVRGKKKLHRSELVVEEARTDRDLADRYAKLLPKEGDRVQDQRFAAPVDYAYSAQRTDEEIRKRAEALHQEQLKGQEEFKRIVQPIEAMVGKPAPPLPAEGWLGGKKPDVAGKPYLIHFWATWCGPCKSDLPRLKALAEKGYIVIGMHPAGTPAAQVEQVIRDRQLGYPTFLAAGQGGDGKVPLIGGYPAGVFPYCVLVDAQGRVVRHGLLWDIIGAVEAERKGKKE